MSKYIIEFSFNLTLLTSKLTKTSHYNKKQQKIYDTIKYLKEVEGLGYRRISHRLKELGIKSSRSLKNGELMLPYSYSTVIDLAKFLGWSTLQFYS